MAVALSDSCVYTIATIERIIEASKSQIPLHELKRWVGAAGKLNEANNAGRELPIVFADSRNCSKLIAWSVLRSVKITEKGTNFVIDRLWSVPRSSPQDLKLIRTKKHIAEGFIRPYALCQTPAFLHVESVRPRIWLQKAAAIKKVFEGKRRLSTHMRIERNRGIVNALKKRRMQQYDGRLPCEICGFDFLEVYGLVGAGFSEAHHKKSLAGSPKNGRVTSLDDFVVVCANCHRMLDRSPEFPSVDSLRTRVLQNIKKPSK